jgi:hypothetical protein
VRLRVRRVVDGRKVGKQQSGANLTETLALSLHHLHMFVVASDGLLSALDRIPEAHDVTVASCAL